MAEASRDNRPLSPHLQVFRPLITMVMSILHRITGGALYFGTLLVAWWLIAAAAGPNTFAHAQGFFGSIIGQIILFAFTAALFYHLCNGIRHLFWDAGIGFELETASKSGYFVLIAAAVLTVVVWVIGYTVGG